MYGRVSEREGVKMMEKQKRNRVGEEKNKRREKGFAVRASARSENVLEGRRYRHGHGHWHGVKGEKEAKREWQGKGEEEERRYKNKTGDTTRFAAKTQWRTSVFSKQRRVQ